MDLAHKAKDRQPDEMLVALATFLAATTEPQVLNPDFTDEEIISPVVCPDRWGQQGEALVKSERTARDIFIAVERDFFPDADRKHFPDVVARDSGKYWGVFRHRDSKRDRPRGNEIVLHGPSHQLEMRIDKCTAEISNVHYSR